MIWTFFYGSWIDLNILREKGLYPEQFEVAKLMGFDIYIEPIANIFPKEGGIVYGILLGTTREKHQKILTALIQGTMGPQYLPEAVIVETLDSKLKPALCYRAPIDERKPSQPEYIDPFVHSAKQWKFPLWYVEHLEKFLNKKNP